MFKDIEKTKIMLQGAYRKLKSYYYYNKYFMVMRKKIAEFENDEEMMHAVFKNLQMRYAIQKNLANTLMG